MLNFFKNSKKDKEKSLDVFQIELEDNMHEELKKFEVAVFFTKEKIAEDSKCFKIVYHDAPKNYKLIRFIEDKNIAILEDLDCAIYD